MLDKIINTYPVLSQLIDNIPVDTSLKFSMANKALYNAFTPLRLARSGREISNQLHNSKYQISYFKKLADACRDGQEDWTTPEKCELEVSRYSKYYNEDKQKALNIINDPHSKSKKEFQINPSCKMSLSQIVGELKSVLFEE